MDFEDEKLADDVIFATTEPRLGLVQRLHILLTGRVWIHVRTPVWFRERVAGHAFVHDEQMLVPGRTCFEIWTEWPRLFARKAPPMESPANVRRFTPDEAIADTKEALEIFKTFRDAPAGDLR